MLALFQIPRAALPEIKPSSGLFGYTRGLNAIPDGIPVMAMVGDSHAALFYHALGELGCVKATYGTGSSVMAPVKSAQCDIDALVPPPSPGTTATASPTDSKVIFRIPAMPWRGWRTAPA